MKKILSFLIVLLSVTILTSIGIYIIKCEWVKELENNTVWKFSDEKFDIVLNIREENDTLEFIGDENCKWIVDVDDSQGIFAFHKGDDMSYICWHGKVKIKKDKIILSAIEKYNYENEDYNKCNDNCNIVVDSLLGKDIELEEKIESKKNVEVNYKEELEEEIEDLEFWIEEHKITIKKGAPKEIEERCKKAIKGLTVIVEKYRQIIEKDKKEGLDYEQVYKEFKEDKDKYDEEREKERVEAYEQ